MINPHALIYSSDQEVTIGNLKDANYNPAIDTHIVAHWMEKYEIKATVEGDHDYPIKVLKIPSKPYILYYQGNLELLQNPTLGIVGPRNHSDFAKSMVKKVISQAKYHNISTVSGLAMGVDQLAHKFSLEYAIPTIAVLGGGFSYFLKSKDRELIQNIVVNGGLILSEFKLSQKPQTYTYPQRNRIIAGISDVLFLPEASKNSGSLITVEFAQKLKKPIYGTPNFTFPSISEGLHEQLQNGKVRPLLDIPAMFNTHFPISQAYSKKSSTSLLPLFDLDTQQLLKFLEKTSSCSISTLLQQGFSQEKIYTALTRLEMENIIHQQDPGVYTFVGQ